MGITMSRQSISRVLTLMNHANDDIENAVAEAYAEVGESVVKGIRDGSLSNWEDQTGALRSSVGYVVIRKGRIVKQSSFEVIRNGADGATKGRNLAEKLANDFADRDFALIVVAGEEYAVYVEAVEGKAVLAQGQLYIEKNIPQLLRSRVRQVLDKYEK